jgi:hypothetical protein
MLGAAFGLDGLIALLVLFVFIVVPIWAVVDAVSRPSAAFAAARSSKALWISLIVVSFFLTGFIGAILAVVYLATIRPRVRAITG